MVRILKAAAFVLLVAAAIFCVFVLWPLRDRHPAVRLASGVLAVRGATIYVSPDRPPLRNATLIARDGRIAVVGEDAPVPAEAVLLPCDACTVTAAFWNTHVHFTEAKWEGAAWASRNKLNAQLADMLTSRGFATVVDLGSDLRVTVSLRRRIESGDLDGPFIYTAGSAIYPENGIPYYLRDSIPKPLQLLMPQPATPQAAVSDVRRNILMGADVLKLFTGTYVERGRVKPMREDIARAAVDEAHRQGQIAFAHPSDLAGVKVALASGVDVLAHAPDTTDGFDDAMIADMARKAAMIPTLKMFGSTVTTRRAYLDPIDDIVNRFHAAGGTLMFGTDVGYMTDYSTAEEFSALEQCGLTPMDVLRMLTTAPAIRLGVAGEKGTLDPGKQADLVILGADPATGAAALSNVRLTVRGGRVIWRATLPPSVAAPR